jgi:DNA (cytosine-5)-methyltransferase 1
MDYREKYARLKQTYSEMVYNKKLANKGDLRALIGSLTAINEFKMIDEGEHPYRNHISALEEALTTIQTNNSHKEIQSYIRLAVEKLQHFEAKNKKNTKNNLEKLIDMPPFSKKPSNEAKLNIFSLFSGAMGLDLGFITAGFKIAVANDIDSKAITTCRTNLPDIPYIQKSIDHLGSDEILKTSGISKEKIDLLLAAPPCQPYSTAGKRRGLKDARSSPLTAFLSLINEFQPRSFVMEEVTGLLSSRIEHVPITERGKQTLNENQQPGSVFKLVLEMLKSTGYQYDYRVLNAADYGAPQSRQRLIIIGLKDGKVSFPEPTHRLKNDLTKYPKSQIWNTLWEGIADIQPSAMHHTSLAGRAAKYMQSVPPGGNWRHLPEDQIQEAMGGAYHAGGGKMGFFRRLAWDEPSPTLLTSPLQKGSMYVHPYELRPLSIEEYKRIQGFPDDWIIEGTLQDQYRQIGNAVPVYLSYAIAQHMKKLLE